LGVRMDARLATGYWASGRTPVSRRAMDRGYSGSFEDGIV
jgi:hypothetical protein